MGSDVQAQLVPEMCWRRSFPGLTRMAGEARGFTRWLLGGHPRLDDALVAVSELFANAARHTRSGLPGGLVVVEVRRCVQGVTVTVTDQGGPEEPVVRTFDESSGCLREGGRGLLTVAAYASRWCWHGDVHGRMVTAFFAED